MRKQRVTKMQSGAKKQKGFVLAYASIVMAVVMIMIAGITSLITAMSQNNSRISDSFYQSVAVDQTLEYFIANYDETALKNYATENGLTAQINATAEQKNLLIYHSENDRLLLEVRIALTGENAGKIIYLTYGEG